MDSEKFDKVVLDLLYDELDELTRASALRHLEQSGHAKALYSELRATREVGNLPLVEPPADLEERILAAEAAARAGRPLRQRFGTFVSIIAGYAMRPQLAMAALLMLMVGSSLLFLRVKPGETSSVQVTERGVPESEKEAVTVVPLNEPPPAPSAAAPAIAETPARVAMKSRADAPHDDLAEREARPASPTAGADLDRRAAKGSMEESELAKRDTPTHAFAAPPPVADESGPAGASADGLGAGSAAMAGGAATTTGGSNAAGGCGHDLAHYEDVAVRDPSAAARNAARFAAAACYAALGRVDRARISYTALLAVPTYSARARQALDALSPPAATDAPAAAAPAKPSASAAPGE